MTTLPVLRRGLFTAILLLLAFQAAQAQTLTVVRVVDGDTYELSDGRRVRLIGVDTPEKWSSAKLDRDVASSGQSRETVQALGELASKHANELVAGKQIELEYDQANAASGHKDRYGRTLAYVWVLEGGRRAYMANERLIADGYANAYTNYPFSRMEAFRGAERAARETKKGLWADDAVIDKAVETAKYGKATDQVFVTNSGKKYHVDGCRSLSKSKIPMSLAMAAGTYEPCSICHPPVLHGFENGAYNASSAGTGVKNTDGQSNSAQTNNGTRTYITGPQGGCYYLNASGNKVYVDRSLCGQSESVKTDQSTGTTPSGQAIHTGPRGGKYVYTKSGKKRYISRKK